jgi:hypothetical protein
MMMQTTNTTNSTNTTTNNSQPEEQQQALLMGEGGGGAPPPLIEDCARVLVAAGLTSNQAPLLSFETLLEMIKLPTLVTVAGHFLTGLAALAAAVAPAASQQAESSPLLLLDSSSSSELRLNVKCLLTVYLIVLHPSQVFARQQQNTPERVALSAAAAPLLDTLSALVVRIASSAAYATTTADDENDNNNNNNRHQQQGLSLELTAALLLRQFGAFKTAFAVWKAIDAPRLVFRLVFSLVSLRHARAAAATDNNEEVCLQIDALAAQIRGKLAPFLQRGDADDEALRLLRWLDGDDNVAPPAPQMNAA